MKTYILRVNFRLFQVKIWFQNRRMKWKRSKKAQQEAKVKDGNQSNQNTDSEKSGKHSKNDQQAQNPPKNLNSSPTTNGPVVPALVPAIPTLLDNRNLEMDRIELENRSIDRDRQGSMGVERDRPVNGGFNTSIDGNPSRRSVGLGFQDGVRGNSSSSMDMFRPYVV